MIDFKPFTTPSALYAPWKVAGGSPAGEQALSIGRQMNESMEQLTRQNYLALGMWMDMAIRQMHTMGRLARQPGNASGNASSKDETPQPAPTSEAPVALLGTDDAAPVADMPAATPAHEIALPLDTPAEDASFQKASLQKKSPSRPRAPAKPTTPVKPVAAAVAATKTPVPKPAAARKKTGAAAGPGKRVKGKTAKG